jgi:hypothetical protein
MKFTPQSKPKTRGDIALEVMEKRIGSISDEDLILMERYHRKFVHVIVDERKRRHDAQ